MTLIHQAHLFLVQDGEAMRSGSGGGKNIVSDLPPPKGYALAAEAGLSALGGKPVLRVSYVGPIVLAAATLSKPSGDETAQPPDDTSPSHGRKIDL